ncbi:MAG: class I SAM-dependent methyltransferase [Candidatus Omnitrophica bacterium]|nr:class I SAM-dependent methyltransferase [Candidatus Omnitrophota bacterium]
MVLELQKSQVLDVGCSRNKVSGAIGIDIDPNSQADIIHDLNQYPYPIESNSFETIMAQHIIEHVNDPVQFMKELYRILKPGGKITFETPHFSSRVAYSEPQHKFFFSYFMFSTILQQIPYKVISQEITFYKTFRFLGIRWLANRFPDTYERFWTYMFPAENVRLIATKKA